MAKIKITDTDLTIRISNVMVVEIGTIRFEWDADYPWITVSAMGDEDNTYLDEINGEDVPAYFGSLEDFKIFCLNWFFKNVEIVWEIKLEEAPEVEAQEPGKYNPGCYSCGKITELHEICGIKICKDCAAIVADTLNLWRK